MKTIPLTRGQVAIVDDEDFARFGGLKWYAQWHPGIKKFYAKRASPRDENNRQTFFLLHRVIMGVTDPKVKVDHKNHDTLDCRRDNLRPCTNAQNMANRSGLGVRNTSGFRGVSWSMRGRNWRVIIVVNGRHIHPGSFPTKIEAAAAYAEANRKYFGEFGGRI